MGNNVKSSGGFVITYRLEDASHDELVSRNLEDASKCQEIRRETAEKNASWTITSSVIKLIKVELS